MEAARGANVESNLSRNIRPGQTVGSSDSRQKSRANHCGNRQRPYYSPPVRARVVPRMCRLRGLGRNRRGESVLQDSATHVAGLRKGGTLALLPDGRRITVGVPGVAVAVNLKRSRRALHLIRDKRSEGKNNLRRVRNHKLTLRSETGEKVYESEMAQFTIDAGVGS